MHNLIYRHIPIQLL